MKALKSHTMIAQFDKSTLCQKTGRLFAARIISKSLIPSLSVNTVNHVITFGTQQTKTTGCWIILIFPTWIDDHQIGI